MTGNDALGGLLARVAASYSGAAFISANELREWPKAAVSAMKKSGLLMQAAPADSTTCDGCEQQCHMPVQTVSRAGRSAAFVVCDKRDDINRVDVSLERLERWHAGGQAIATFLAGRLNANRAASIRTQDRQWSVGIVRGQKKTAPVVLSAVDSMVLEFAGHSIPLEEVLSLTAQGLVLRRAELEDYIDNPKPGGRGRESKSQRQQRLLAAIADEKTRGTPAPVNTVAVGEGITRQMLHKIVRQPKKSAT